MYAAIFQRNRLTFYMQLVEASKLSHKKFIQKKESSTMRKHTAYNIVGYW